MRYDPDQGIVTLLVLEADWQALHVDTVLLLISSSANCTSNAVKLKTGCKTSTNNPCCFANETVEKISKNDREMVEILRSKKRKPRLGRNFSCVNISCVSDRRSSGLQKYDSCYRLEILSSHDVIIPNTGHVHRSTDCLVMEERHSKVPERLFPTGIDSPFYQLKDDISLEKMIPGDVVTRNGGHAIEDDSDSKLVTTTKERMHYVSQLFGLRDVTFVTRKKAKTEHLEVSYEPKGYFVVGVFIDYVRAVFNSVWKVIRQWLCFWFWFYYGFNRDWLLNLIGKKAVSTLPLRSLSTHLGNNSHT